MEIGVTLNNELVYNREFSNLEISKALFLTALSLTLMMYNPIKFYEIPGFKPKVNPGFKPGTKRIKL